MLTVHTLFLVFSRFSDIKVKSLMGRCIRYPCDSIIGLDSLAVVRILGTVDDSGGDRLEITVMMILLLF